MADRSAFVRYGLAAVLLLAGQAATAQAARRAPAGSRARPLAAVADADADSLSLIRTRCYGLCPAYRLTITAAGAVRFAPEDSSRTGSSQAVNVGPDAFRALAEEADRIGFRALPPVIQDDPSLCAVRATDHPTVTVTLFRRNTSFPVADYQGCFASNAGHALHTAAGVAQLRHFESMIDSIADSRRWLSRSPSNQED